MSQEIHTLKTETRYCKFIEGREHNFGNCAKVELRSRSNHKRN